LKYYLDHENGIRMELALVAQWGPNFSYWEDDDQDVTPFVLPPDRNIGVSGYGWQLTVNFPL
jgi:hypothetical protein